MVVVLLATVSSALIRIISEGPILKRKEKAQSRSVDMAVYEHKTLTYFNKKYTAISYICSVPK